MDVPYIISCHIEISEYSITLPELELQKVQAIVYLVAESERYIHLGYIMVSSWQSGITWSPWIFIICEKFSAFCNSSDEHKQNGVLWKELFDFTGF